MYLGLFKIPDTTLSKCQSYHTFLLFAFQMETSAQEVHENLNNIIDYQTHHRLRETQGRKRAEDLNERVMIWSVFVTLSMICVGISQVFVLKSFFSEKRPSQMYGYH